MIEDTFLAKNISIQQNAQVNDKYIIGLDLRYHSVETIKVNKNTVR